MSIPLIKRPGRPVVDTRSCTSVLARPSSSKVNATCTCAVRSHGTTLLALPEPRRKSAHSTKPAPTHPRERATSSPAASSSSLVWPKIDLSQKSATNSIPTVPRAHSRKYYETTTHTTISPKPRDGARTRPQIPAEASEIAVVVGGGECHLASPKSHPWPR